MSDGKNSAMWKRRIVDSGYNANWKCSNCGYVLYLETTLEICPKCKAYMWEGEQNE